MVQSETAMARELYTGEISYEAAGSGVTVCRSDFTLHRNHVLDTRHEPRELFQLGFCLGGWLQWRYPQFSGGELAIGEKESLPQLGSVERSVSTFSENQRCRGLNILLEKQRFENLIACFRCEGAAIDLRENTLPTARAVTPKVSIITQQIADCDICGDLRPIYLEGKVLELLAVYFNEVVCQQDISQKQEGISKEDYACLLKAKELINRRYAHPLTISVLAREVCLNEYKLKRGFKHCFGVTVLEYMVNRRMEMARLLLAEGRHMVKDVAWMVGYAKPSHFIDAYKKHHGVTPGEAGRS